MDVEKLMYILPLAVWANWQLVETFNHGEIFANMRAWLEVRGGFIADLMLCPFCISHWTAMPVTTAALLSVCEPSWQLALIAPLFWLSIIRLANVANDLGHPFWRTPKSPLDLDSVAALEDLAQPPEKGDDEPTP